MTEKKIDEDWKARARREKEELTKRAEASGNTQWDKRKEGLFMALIKSLFMKLGMLAQAGRIEEGKELVETILALDLKTKDNQTTEEKSMFTRIRMELRTAGLIEEANTDSQTETD